MVSNEKFIGLVSSKHEIEMYVRLYNVLMKKYSSTYDPLLNLLY